MLRDLARSELGVGPMSTTVTIEVPVMTGKVDA